MPKDVMARTGVGSINLTGQAFDEYALKILNDYGVKVMINGVTSQGHNSIYLYGRKKDMEIYLRQAYGCQEGEEESFIKNEEETEIDFFNFTVLDHYLKDKGWQYSSQDGRSKGKTTISRFYDHTANDGTKVRFYFHGNLDEKEMDFTVINYSGHDNEVIEGRAFTMDRIAEGVEYAESFLDLAPILTPAQAWLKRGGDKINLRPIVDF